MENQEQNTVEQVGNGGVLQPPLSSDLGGTAAPLPESQALSYAPDSLSQPDVVEATPLRQSLLHRLLRPVNLIALGVVVLSLLGLAVFRANHKDQAAVQRNDISKQYGTIKLPLDQFLATEEGVAFAGGSVTINGPLKLNQGVVITPSVQPNTPTAGQLYFDQNTNQLAYFNGVNFVPLSASGQVVQSIGGLSGQITLGGGLTVVDNQLVSVNNGVLSFGGQTGAITVGTGLTMVGSTIQNGGLLSLTSGTPATLNITSDGNGNLVINNTGAGTGTVTSAGGTTGALALFTGSQNIEDSLITQSGTTITITGDLNVVTGGLSLGNALTVSNGGTGATSLAANGVIVGSGTAALTSVVAGGSGLCLMSTAGIPNWAACPGTSGVTTLNGLAGALTVANASAAGSTITIDNASTAAKGIASFNSANFTASSGAINTIQDINTTASPTFGRLIVTSSQATNPMLLVNNTNLAATGNLLDLQLNGSSKFSVQPSGNIVAAGTFNGQTISSAANFTGTVGVAGDTTLTGDLFVNGGDINSTGALNITPGGAFTVGSTTQTLALQGGTSSSFRVVSGVNSTTVNFQAPTATVIYRLATAAAGTYDICTSAGNCSGGGGGVTTPGGTTNKVPKFTGAQTIGDSTLSDDGTTVSTTANIAIQGGAATIGVANSQTGSLLLAYGAANFSGTITQGALTANRTYTLPDASGTVCLSSGNCLGGGGGGANTSLSNLTSVAINTSLLPGGTTVDLGSATAPFRDLYIAGSSLSPGTNNYKITGTATAGRTITLPDASGTVCLNNSTNCGFLTGAGTAFVQNGNTLGATANLGTNDNFDLNLRTNGTTALALSTTGDATFSGAVTINGSTLSSAGALNITPAGTLTIGSTAQTLALQGGSSTSFKAVSGANSTTVNFQAPTASVTYRFATAVAGTYDICTTVGNCSGSGGGVTTPGGSANKLAKFTASQTIGDSSISDDGTTVTSSVNLVVQGGTATLGVLSTQAGTLVLADGSSAFAGSITQGILTANRTYTLPDASGTVCLSSGNCLGGGGGGANTALSNLSSVAINTSLLPGSTSIDLGSATAPFRNLYIAGSSLSPGTNNYQITGTATAARTITLPDATGTVCLNGTSACGFATGTGSAFVQNGNSFGTAGVLGTNDNNALNLRTNGSTALALSALGDATFSGAVTINGSSLTSAAALNITPGGTLTVGAAAQALILQGNASTTLAANGNGFTTTVGFNGTAVANVNYNFDRTVAAGTYTICSTIGNCAGSGTGVTTAGGTVGTIPVFTGTQAIGNSLLSQSGSIVTANADVNLTVGHVYQINGTQISSAALTNDSDLAKLSASQTFTGNTVAFKPTSDSTNAFNLQNATGRYFTADGTNNQIVLGAASSLDGKLVFNNISNANTVTILPGTPTTARTVTLPNASGIICLDSGNCAGAGATLQTAYNFSVGGTVPKIKLNSTLKGLDIQDADTTIAADLLDVRASNAGGLGSVLFGVGNTGVVTLQNSVNSTLAMAVLTQGGTKVLTVDTTNGQAVLGQSTTLNGTLVFNNATNSNQATLTTNAVTANRSAALPDESGTICIQNSTNCGFAISAGSTAYIQNQFLAVQTGNYNIQGNGDHVVGSVRASVGQTADIFQVLNSSGTPLFQIDSDTNYATFTDNVIIAGQSSGSLTVKSSNNGGGGLILDAQRSGGASVFRVTDDGVLALGNNTGIGGLLGIEDLTTTHYGQFRGNNLLTSDRNYYLPDSSGVICLDSGNCGASTGTLQSAYNYSTGGSTPEIKLDSTRSGLDIQDSDAGLSAGQNFISFRGPNAGGLGSILFGVGIQGNIFMQPSTNRTDYVDINNQAGNNLFALDSTNNRLGIAQGGTTLPTYTLDVGGDTNISSGSVYRINGASTLSAGSLTFATASTNTIQAASGQALNVSSTSDLTLATNAAAAKIIAKSTTNGAAAFQIQDSASAGILTANTLTRTGVVAGNMIKIGDSTGTDTDLTILQLDSVTANPTTNLASMNGGLFYNSTTNKVSLIENGAVKIICNTTDLGCGTGTVTLQNAYTNSLGGTTSEIILDATRGALDIQDRSTSNGGTLGGNLLNVRATAANDSTAGTSLFAVSSTGNVGIGAATPARSLDIATNDSNTTAPAFRLLQGGTGDATIELNTPATSIYLGIDNSAGGAFKISSTAANGATINSGFYGFSPAGFDSGNNGQVSSTQVTSGGSSGTLNSVSVYFQNAVGNAQVGLYADNGSDAPGALITTSSSQAATEGWNTFTMSTSIAATTKYWIGFNVTNGSMQYGQVSSPRRAWQNATYGTFPNPFGTPTGTDASNAYLVYMTYTPSGSPDAFSGNLFSLTTTGQATFKNSADSTSGFQVQNSSSNAIIMVKTSDGAQNVITNSGFENGATGWSTRGSPGNFTTVSTQHHSGNSALYVEGGGAANDGAKFITTLSDSTWYVVSFYAKIGVGDQNMTTLAAGYSSDGSTDTNCSLTSTLVVSAGWGRYECFFVTPGSHSGSPYFYVKQTDASNRDMYFDDFLIHNDDGDFDAASNGSIDLQGTISSPLRLQGRSDMADAFTIQNADSNTIMQVGTLDTTNIITNPSFEHDSNGWDPIGGSTSAFDDYTQGWIGNASYKVTTSATANAGAYFVLGNTFPTRLSTSTTYTLSWVAKLSSGTFTDIKARYTRNGSSFVECTPATQTLSTAGWTRFSCTFTTDGTSPTASADIRIVQTAATAHTFWIDGVRLEAGSAAGNFGTGTLGFDAVINSPVSIRNKSDSTAAFNIQNTAGTNIFNVDTLNSIITMASPSGSNFVTIDTPNSKFFVGSAPLCGGRFCVGTSLAGSSGGTTYTNLTNVISADNTLGGASFLIGQDINITDTGSTFANTIRGIRVDTSSTTNTLDTINSFHAKLPSTTSDTQFAGSAILIQNGSTDMFKLTNTGAMTLQNTLNSTTALKVTNAAGTSYMNLSTLSGTNEVLNGDFENANLNGWSLRGSAANLAISSTTAQFGRYALNFDTVSASGNGVQYSAALKPSTTYSLSMWLRRDTGSSTAFNIGRNDNPPSFGSATNDTNCTTTPGTITVDTTWRQYTCSFTTGATVNSASNIYLKQTDTSTDNVYIDGVTLYQSASPVTYISPASGLDVAPFYNNMTINAANNGELQPWTNNVNQLTGARSRAGVTTYNGYMYVAGGGTGSDGASPVTTVMYGKLNADGSVGAFTNTSTLGTAVSAMNMVAMNGYLYVLGGSTTGGSVGAVATVQYARINNDGTVGTWSTTTSLPGARFIAAITSYNGYMYVIGGQDAGASFMTTTYYAKPTALGDIPSWSSGNTIASGSYTNQAVVANGYLYVSVGAGDTSRIDYAKVNADGSVGAYVQTTSLPASKGDYGIGAMNGYVYVIGGYSLGVNVNTIYYAATKSDGTLTPWLTAANPLPFPRENLRTVTSNGYIYVVGGDTTATQSSILYSSGARLKINGALDLVGGSSQSLNESDGGQLTAGNTNIVGTLQVQESVTIMRNLTVNGNAAFQNGTNSTSSFAVTNATSVPQLTVDTTNSRVYLGTIAGDNTGTTLVLGNKNNAGEPTGVNGAIYYSKGGSGGANSGGGSFAGKLRCFEGNMWKNCVGMREVVERRWGYAVAADTVSGAIGYSGFITNGQIVSGVGTVGPQAESMYLSYSTAATNGTSNGWGTTGGFPANVTQGRWLPKFSTRVRVGSTTANVRYWAALTEDPMTATDPTTTTAAEATEYIGMIASSAVAGGAWICGSGDGTTQSGVSSGVTMTANHYYDIIVDMSISGTLVCSIADNGGAFTTVTKTTNLPNTATSLGISVNLTTLTNAIRTLLVQYVYIESQ